MNRWLRVAVICAAAPLIIGVGIFLVWLLTRWNWLMNAGLFMILGGLVLMVAGAMSLIIFVRMSIRTGRTPRKKVVWQAVAVSGLLLFNVPAAVAIAASVLHVHTKYVVSVVNDSEMTVRSFTVSGGGVSVDFGTVRPHSTERRVFWIKHDGELIAKGMQDDKPIGGVIDGYVTNDAGGYKLVRIASDGRLEVHDSGLR